jgi:phosphatidylglycerophosphate synthase
MSFRLLAGRTPTRLLDPIVGALSSIGVTPTAVTIAGFAGNVGAAVLIANGELLAGGIVMLVASAVDMLDGALARATGTATRFGAVLDSTVDRLSEAAVLFGVLVYETGLGNREEALLVFVAVTGSLLVSYVRARAEAHGVVLTEGLFTRPERVVLLGAALITGWLRPGLWVLAVLTPATALHRLYLARQALREEQP